MVEIDEGHGTLLVSGAADRALPGSGASLPSDLGACRMVRDPTTNRRGIVKSC